MAKIANHTGLLVGQTTPIPANVQPMHPEHRPLNYKYLRQCLENNTPGEWINSMFGGGIVSYISARSETLPVVSNVHNEADRVAITVLHNCANRLLALAEIADVLIDGIIKDTNGVLTDEEASEIESHLNTLVFNLTGVKFTQR